ncbi:protein kinase [Strigomonas culicis]|nr:protein kinase [Strigomonas culicis]|eukprot:EPY25733.1 protein kinase [Strigomonas culicis]
MVQEGALQEPTARRIVTQLLMAIEYIHSKGIVHRDMKPANCLVSNTGTVKISDFGFAVLAGSGQCLSTYCGTVCFMAPEILLDRNYGKPVDMWALGVMTYYMFLDAFPFHGRNTEALKASICRDSASVARHERLQQFPLLQDFIVRLLEFDANKRLTAGEALKHPWIKSGMDAMMGRTSLSAPVALQRTVSSTGRFRAAVMAVIAAHRLLVLRRCHRLAKMGFRHVSILYNFHFFVTGKYAPSTDKVNCSRVFAGTPGALDEFLEMVESCDYIHEIDLSHNNINSLSTVQHLLKVIGHHPSIASLDLSHNPIPAVAGRGLVRLARNPLSRIHSVNLKDTNITPDTVSQIQALLADKTAYPDLASPDSSFGLESRTYTTPDTLSTVSSHNTCAKTKVPSSLRSSLVLFEKSRMPEGPLGPTPVKRSSRLTRLPPLPKAALPFSERPRHKKE